MSAPDDEGMKAIEKHLRETLARVDSALKAKDWPSLESKLSFVTGLLTGAAHRAFDDLKKAGVIQ